ncbi:Sigma-70 family RNA polymerase sigma factor, partial [Dysosmobacter welbionis]
DEVCFGDVQRGLLQSGRDHQPVRDQIQGLALAVGQAHHAGAGGHIGVQAQLRGPLVGYLALADHVLAGEKRLAVEALLIEAILQKFEDQLVWVHGGGLAQHLDGGVKQTDLVILNGVAVDADGQLEILVLDGIVRRAEVLDLTVADPFPHAGDVAEPRIGLSVRGG